MKGACYICAIVLLWASYGEASESFKPRRISFARCHSEVEMPQAVFLNCANAKGKGSCEVRKGNTHNLRAIFRSKFNSSNIDSYVVWKNGWFSLPLPNQERDACLSAISCPLVMDGLTKFTYALPIDDFFPPGSYPVQWTLTDKDTDEEIVCFRFKIVIN